MFFFFFNFEENSDKMPSKKANKGEWSEVYTIFRLLGDGKLYLGDEHTNKLAERYFPIIEIIREELIGKCKNDYRYELKREEHDINKEVCMVEIFENGIKLLEMSPKDFVDAADSLLEEIRSGKGRSFATSVRNELFMETVHCRNIKRDSKHKSDLVLGLYDIKSCIEHRLGMSVKSFIGSAPTLLNASDATLVTYVIDGVNLQDDDIAEINNISTSSKMKDRIAAIYAKGGNIVFKEYESETFRNNLDLIDSGLPFVLSVAILCYYSARRKSSLKEITAEVAKVNPLGTTVSDKEMYYEKKLTRLLEASALGMFPSKPYDESSEAKGYIIVKDDGDVVCYHFYDRDVVRKHLFDNTKFDTPQSAKKDKKGKAQRKPFGVIYRNDLTGETEIQLNFQIRWVD